MGRKRGKIGGWTHDGVREGDGPKRGGSGRINLLYYWAVSCFSVYVVVVSRNC